MHSRPCGQGPAAVRLCGALRLLLLLCLASRAIGVRTGALGSRSSRGQPGKKDCGKDDPACFCSSAGRQGTYRDSQCSGWYSCANSTSGLYFSCPPGLLFDTSCGCCTWPSKVQCDSSGAYDPAGDKPPVTPDQVCTHVVQKGEDINMIAQSMGTTVALIQQLNPGVNVMTLRPGQKLKVPCPASEAAGWQAAVHEVFSSYPCCCKPKPSKDCDMTQCQAEEGGEDVCAHQGHFDAFKDPKPEDWVKKNRITEFYGLTGSPQYSDLMNRTIIVRSRKRPSNYIKAVVVSSCDDAACNGCCTAGASMQAADGVLLRMEYYTAAALFDKVQYGYEEVEWQLVV